MNTKQVYIHVGMPRTATTFLQQQVFPNFSDVEFYGLEHTHFSEVFNQLQYADDSLYNPNVILESKKNWTKNKVILSNENFIGQSPNLNFINRTLIAKRLKIAFPDAKILLILRNQLDLLTSLYTINLQWKETRKIDEFIWEPFQNKSKNGSNGPAVSYFNTLECYENLDGYRYTPLIELYQSLFKEVEVVLFEDFIHQPKILAEQLANFFTIEPAIIEKLILNKPKLNTGVTSNKAKKLIRLNKIAPLVKNSQLANRIHNKLKRNIIQSKRKSEQISFSEEKKSYIKNYFKKDNLTLSENHPRIKHYKANYFID